MIAWLIVAAAWCASLFVIGAVLARRPRIEAWIVRHILGETGAS